MTLQQSLDRLERKLLQEAVKTNKHWGNMARALGLSRPTLYRKLAKHGLPNKHGDRINFKHNPPIKIEGLSCE